MGILKVVEGSSGWRIFYVDRVLFLFIMWEEG